MMKNDNAHALRLVQGLRQIAGEAAAQCFAQELPLSKSADVGRKFQWARSACAWLEEHFDEETVRAIRRECRCNDGRAIADKLLRYLKRNASLREAVEDFDRCETFASLEYVTENSLLLCYPACCCACVKRAPGELSRAWCLCTLGNAEAIFRAVLGETVRVALVESIKTGGERCVIRVEWEAPATDAEKAT